MPSKNAIAAFGLIVVLYRIFATFAMAWFLCLLSIIAVETVRVGKDVAVVGYANLPTHYYWAAFYGAMALVGLIMFLRQGLFQGFMSFSASEKQD